METMVAPSKVASAGQTVSLADVKATIVGLESKISELRSSRLSNWTSLASIAQSLGVLPDSSSLKVRRLLKGHFGKVYSADWAGSGNELVSASQDGKLIIWDAMLSKFR